MGPALRNIRHLLPRDIPDMHLSMAAVRPRVVMAAVHPRVVMAVVHPRVVMAAVHTRVVMAAVQTRVDIADRGSKICFQNILEFEASCIRMAPHPDACSLSAAVKRVQI
jgi:hypothetical protein